MTAKPFATLMNEIRQCQLCAPELAHEPRPVLQGHPAARIILIGQAPGSKVQASGIPWDDASGDTLRRWLHVDRTVFYDPRRFAIVPMGFCYPGRGKSGDLPPKSRCAPQWHPQLLAHMRGASLVLLIGQYAQARYLGSRRGRNLTETVRQWRRYRPTFMPLPHPSPRNRFWLRKNPWFAETVLPELQQRVQQALAYTETLVLEFKKASPSQ